ncbi:EamA family transporter [Lactococcus protaetiae]|uniref:EamA family transporter n=1 Tax=Lactococcus protaetiae TaxID=2592653 RepID=A0A514Z9G9_9LACT|nr:EamA family transporter [Lactococcus protaetiae]QDK71210.1 EamA family transporter [Lactococcus protaetiae]
MVDCRSFWVLGKCRRHSLLFLILSGLATGASWLCYYRALQIGKVAGVVAVDQSSVLFSVILAIIFLGERSKFEITLIGLLIIALGMFFIVLESNKNIDKTSIAVATFLAFLFLREKPSKLTILGLGFIVFGRIVIAF